MEFPKMIETKDHFGFFLSQGRGGNQVRWTECRSNEGTTGKGGETCIPGGGQPYDETHHQLPLQKQRGKESSPFLAHTIQESLT